MNVDELRAENEALRHRLTRLTAAILRVGGSLDLRTVLQEVVDGARELTQARYGVIATVGPEGDPEPLFVTSGLSADQRQSWAGWPDAPALCERLRSVSVGGLPIMDSCGIRKLDTVDRGRSRVRLQGSR